MIKFSNKIWMIAGMSIAGCLSFFLNGCKDEEVVVGSAQAQVERLECSQIAVFGTLVANDSPYEGTFLVPYTGGNGLSYTEGAPIASTGLTGLTATLLSGELADGSGIAHFRIKAGMLTSPGTAVFDITVGGQSCQVKIIVVPNEKTITSLNCEGAVFSSVATSGESYIGTVTIPYAGGDGTSFGARTAVASTGALGLSATLAAGTLAQGAGTITLSITGIPKSSEIASFFIYLGGKHCWIDLPVVAPKATACETLTGTERVVCLANVLKASLTSSQQAYLMSKYTYANIKTWSNLPPSQYPRLGLNFAWINATQPAPVQALLEEINGATVNEGFDEIQQIWLADDYLAANGGGSTYGSGKYYLALFGSPSLTDTFEIMMTGHNKTLANTYKDGKLIGATPRFSAVEPISFTSSNGLTYAPLSQEHDALVALLNSLSEAEKATARSSSTFSDLLLPPDKNWQFPTTSTGLKCSSLSNSQKDLVLAAIHTYVGDLDEANATAIMETYTAEINNTYLTFSGTTSMNSRNDYFRIDGPRVWIEFIVTDNILLSGVHYHSIWRDRISDYGGTRN